jgi:F-type H+-transporting ATPase subunit a
VNKRFLIIGLLAFTVAAAAVSFLVIKPSKPIIVIHGEPLATVGPLDILNTLFSAWVIMALLLMVSFMAVRKAALIPSGFYNFFEAIIEGIFNFITGIAGERHGRRFFPVIATFFIYIAFANWLSLTPIFNSIGAYMPLHAEEDKFHEHAVVFKEAGGINLLSFGAEDVELHADECAAGHEGDECRHHAIEEAEAASAPGDDEKIGVLFPYLRGINTDLMTPLSFAIVSVFFIEYWGITTVGFFRYMSRFFTLRSPIDAIVGLLEFVAEAARLVSFAFRLFGNMLAGEILILVMTFLLAVITPVMILFYGLELMVGGIQAFVFAMLTLVFAMLAVSEHGGEQHGSEQHGVTAHTEEHH